jgi:hypothetical protein
LSSGRGFKAWFRSLSEASKVAFVVAVITASGTLVAALIGGAVAVYTASGSKATALPSSTPATTHPTEVQAPTSQVPADAGSSSSATENSLVSTPSSYAARSDTDEAATSADVKIQSVDIEISDTYKAGAGLYQLGGRKTINLRFWWTTTTNYGPIDSGDKDCTVIATMTTKPSNKVVDTYRTANCTFSGWVEMFAPEGVQEIAVDVTLANGSHSRGVQRIRVIP